MKIKSEFILKNIAGDKVVVFLSPEFSDKVVTLNDTGAFLFGLLKTEQTKESLTEAMTNEYDIDSATAGADVSRFWDSLSAIGALE